MDLDLELAMFVRTRSRDFVDLSAAERCGKLKDEIRLWLDAHLVADRSAVIDRAVRAFPGGPDGSSEPGAHSSAPARRPGLEQCLANLGEELSGRPVEEIERILGGLARRLEVPPPKSAPPPAEPLNPTPEQVLAWLKELINGRDATELREKIRAIAAPDGVGAVPGIRGQDLVEIFGQIREARKVNPDLAFRRAEKGGPVVESPLIGSMIDDLRACSGKGLDGPRLARLFAGVLVEMDFMLALAKRMLVEVTPKAFDPVHGEYPEPERIGMILRDALEKPNDANQFEQRLRNVMGLVKVMLLNLTTSWPSGIRTLFNQFDPAAIAARNGTVERSWSAYRSMFETTIVNAEALNRLINSKLRQDLDGRVAGHLRDYYEWRIKPR